MAPRVVLAQNARSSTQGALFRAKTCLGAQVTRSAAVPLDRSLTQPVPSVAKLASVPVNANAAMRLRQEHSENVAASSVQCPAGVDGLLEFLASRLLEAHFSAASKWCEEMGAADLEEVLENRTALSDELGLSPQECTRLFCSEPVASTGQAKSPGTTARQLQPVLSLPASCTQSGYLQVGPQPLRTTTITGASASSATVVNMNSAAASNVTMLRTRTSPTTHVEADVAKRRSEQAYIPLRAWAPERVLAAPSATVGTRSTRKLLVTPQSAGGCWDGGADAELVEESYYMAKGVQTRGSVEDLGWHARKYIDPSRGYVDPRLLRQQAPSSVQMRHPFAQQIADLRASKQAQNGPVTFEQLRTSIWKEHGAELRDNLSNCLEGNVTIEPAPVSRAVQQRFLQGYAAAPFSDVIPTYHGSAASNYESICRRGLLIPGRDNELRVEHGAAHGRGVYTARVDNPSLSRSFCTEPSMLICGVVDDSDTLTATEKCGRFSVSAKSKSVKHVGSAVVVADDRRVAPLFQVNAQNFRDGSDARTASASEKVTTLESWLATRQHVSTTQPRCQDESYMSQVMSTSGEDPRPCGPRKHFVDVGKGQVLNATSGEKAFMPPVAVTYSYDVKQKRIYEQRKRDIERIAMRSQKAEDAGM